MALKDSRMLLRSHTRAYTLVAEHILGWQRKPPQGTIGGGTVGTESSETWNGCHQRITPERRGEPCPAYRFPDITLLALVCVDPLRSQDRFLALLHGLRLLDTDAPLTLLIEVLGTILAQDALAPLPTHLTHLCAEAERDPQS
jgi:hypothetical protein